MRTNIDTLILTGFVCCGIARLARFNATVAQVPKDASGKSKYFEGLPIPTSLVLVGVMAGCVYQGAYEAMGSRAPGSGLPWGLVRQLQSSMGIDVHWFTLLFAGCVWSLVPP
jgi:CDP-diacylglycerol--serine O-phosphatidyltransferase